MLLCDCGVLPLSNSPHRIKKVWLKSSLFNLTNTDPGPRVTEEWGYGKVRAIDYKDPVSQH